ncbi:MAG: MerR family transcriptional regulator [Tannerella sp.]|jgi:DNA-binding transcriptional MerR regulator|nr:MerR family transcriptional regulator [Tannerella sp.]
MSLKKEKEPKLFYSIKEVAQQFGINESTLRFWEKEFDEISPQKNGKGTRQYQKKDIENIRLIHRLLKEQGLTLAGAKQKLRDNKDDTVNHDKVCAQLKLIRSELVSLMNALNVLGEEEKIPG